MCSSLKHTHYYMSFCCRIARLSFLPAKSSHICAVSVLIIHVFVPDMLSKLSSVSSCPVKGIDTSCCAAVPLVSSSRRNRELHSPNNSIHGGARQHQGRQDRGGHFFPGQSFFHVLTPPKSDDTFIYVYMSLLILRSLRLRSTPYKLRGC